MKRVLEGAYDRHYEKVAEFGKRMGGKFCALKLELLAKNDSEELNRFMRQHGLKKKKEASFPNENTHTKRYEAAAGSVVVQNMSSGGAKITEQGVSTTL